MNLHEEVCGPALQRSPSQLPSPASPPDPTIPPRAVTGGVLGGSHARQHPPAAQRPQHPEAAARRPRSAARRGPSLAARSPTSCPAGRLEAGGGTGFGARCLCGWHSRPRGEHGDLQRVRRRTSARPRGGTASTDAPVPAPSAEPHAGWPRNITCSAWRRAHPVSAVLALSDTAPLHAPGCSRCTSPGRQYGGSTQSAWVEGEVRRPPAVAAGRREARVRNTHWPPAAACWARLLRREARRCRSCASRDRWRVRPTTTFASSAGAAWPLDPAAARGLTHCAQRTGWGRAGRRCW